MQQVLHLDYGVIMARSSFIRANRLDHVTERTGGRSAKNRAAVLLAAEHLLSEEGVEALTYRKIAILANVSPSTIYRRWPERAGLIADTLNHIAESYVLMTNTGCIQDDLRDLLKSIANLLNSGKGKRFVYSLIAAVGTGDEEVKEAIKGIWQSRLKLADKIFEEAIKRGEISNSIRVRQATEMLVSPLWFKAIISCEEISDEYIQIHTSTLNKFFTI